MNDKVLLAGEAMALFIANEEGPLDAVNTYSMAVAGAELNVAIGLTRLGHSVSYMTRLGSDPFGKRIANEISRNHISTDMITWEEEHKTGFMLKGKTHEGDPAIYYFRKNSAASMLCADDIRKVDLSSFGCVHLTGILPALSECACEATVELAKKARSGGILLTFDPNLRPQLWPDRQHMVSTINSIAAMADIVMPGEAEGEQLCGTRDPEQIGKFYRDLGVRTVLVKIGKRGTYVVSDAFHGLVKGFHVSHVVDTVGAGDGFAAGVLSALIEGKGIADAVERGNAVGALQVMNVGDNEGLPDREKLAEFMGISSSAL